MKKISMKQESSGCLELNKESVWMLHQHKSFLFGIIKEKKYDEYLKYLIYRGN